MTSRKQHDGTEAPDRRPLPHAAAHCDGRPINDYAFGDLKTLPGTLDKVLGWAQKMPNGFMSTEDHAADWKETRDGLGKLRDSVIENGDSIRAQRKTNGLENRN